MNSVSHSTKYSLLAVSVGIVIGYGLFFLTEDNSVGQYEDIAVLESRISELEYLLAKKDHASLRLDNANSNQYSKVAARNDEAAESIKEHLFEQSINDSTNSDLERDTQQILKELGTRNDFNPRTFSERINDFLSTNPGKENIAIATKAVVDMAENSDSLPNFELEAVYQKQTDPNLKRVAAQVLSMRGDNSLLEKQIVDTQSGLKNENPEVRQKTLIELAKTHYAGAANVIAPLLQDKNVGVKLDALLALRATGNESHIHLVQDLVNHPDPSVSWLAKDVVSNLQNLSEHARTRINSQDIVAELPPINNP